MSLKVYVSKYLDPYINLAIEDKLLKSIHSEDVILYFYSNKPCIVYGRFQNPWTECNVQKSIEDNVHLVRRQSGGGCVYHDEGNLNFCFIYPEREFRKEINNSIIINALNDFSIKAYASGRSDLFIKHKEDAYKFSGSAFKQKKDRSFHHGTLLIEGDLENLGKYLRPRDLKITKSKGIKSNPSKVINLRAINENIDKESIIQSIVKHTAKEFRIASQYINLNDFIPTDYYHELSAWEWIWGETPEFNLHFKDYEITVRKGRIIDVKQDGQKILLEYYGLELARETLEKTLSNSKNHQLSEIFNYLLKTLY